MAPEDWINSQEEIDSVRNDEYSDWWYPGDLTRSVKINVPLNDSGQSITINNKTIRGFKMSIHNILFIVVEFFISCLPRY